MSNELAIKELKSLLRFKQGIANLEKPNNAMSEHTIDKAKEEVISLQSTIDTLSGADISDDKIREIFLRNSKVREFELKDGAKVGYRVTGIEESEKAVKEISDLIPKVNQDNIIASGKVKLIIEGGNSDDEPPYFTGVYLEGKKNMYLNEILTPSQADELENKEIDLIWKEKR